MRLRRGETYLLTVIDGTVLRGRAAWSWRWRVVRLVGASVIPPEGEEFPTAGPVLLPHRSIVVAQEVIRYG